MEYFLQSHFGSPLGLPACLAIKALRFTGCRIDAQQTTILDLRAILAEVAAADLSPLVIASNQAVLAILPRGADVEPMNEPNLKGVSPEQYCTFLDAALPQIIALGLNLWIPSVSNLNADGLHYVAEILRLRPNLPPTVGISAHDYDDHNDHLAAFKHLIGTRSWAITEFGYNAHKTRWKFWDPGLSDADAAEKIRRRWVKLAAQGATIASLYQRLDGDGASDRFGIYRTNGTIKPQAYMIP